MNEKIKQLYNRALQEYFGEEYKNCELDIYPEDQYFAELIIQECARVCVQENPDPRDSIELQSANRILKHFELE
jgi:hypothetical protein